MAYSNTHERRWEIITAYEKTMQYKEVTPLIPAIYFESDWGIKIIPPHTGATVRFLVEYKIAEVSVFLDAHDALGSISYGLHNKGSKPYWEIYPYYDDVARVSIENTTALKQLIKESINQQLRYEDDTTDT